MKTICGGRLRKGSCIALVGMIVLTARPDQVTVDCPLGFSRTGNHLEISWQPPKESPANLVLQTAPDLNGPWTTIPDAPEPFIVSAASTPRFIRVALPTPPGCPSSEQIAHSIRSFAFSSRTNLNPETHFDIRLEPIRDLWETLGTQAFVVRYLAAGQEFDRETLVVRGSTVKKLGQSFGGFGLMSGLVKGQSFYFTYSWGSGIHRSHVGKLRLVDNAIRIWDGGGFYNRDVFLTRKPDQTIAVESGRFQGVNRWADSAPFGVMDESDPEVPKILGGDGTVLATLAPVGP